MLLCILEVLEVMPEVLEDVRCVLGAAKDVRCVLKVLEVVLHVLEAVNGVRVQDLHTVLRSVLYAALYSRGRGGRTLVAGIGGASGDALCAALYAGSCWGWALFCWRR